MPLWFLIQLGLLLFWFLVSFFMYYFSLWNTSFPFSRTKSFRMVFLNFFPFIWLASSFIVGLLYIGLNITIRSDLIPVLSLLIIPGILIIVLASRLMIRNKILQNHEIFSEKLIEQKRKEIEEWKNNFNFLNEDNIEIKLYMSRGRPVGRVKVGPVNKAEYNKLKNNNSNLPEGIYLEIIDIDDYGRTLH
jgi:hypothetical protein